MSTDPDADLAAEVELLKKIGAGDQRSFEEFYDRFSGLLFSVALRVVNNHEAAEDVLQDVFFQIWEKAPLYDPARGKPMTWAITLTRNKAIDRLRATQRRSRLQDDLQNAVETVAPCDDQSCLNALSSAESGEVVRKALQKLSEDQRKVIELAFFSSLTQTEISARLQEPLGTVKARIRRGMIKLRSLLSGEQRRDG